MAEVVVIMIPYEIFSLIYFYALVRFYGRVSSFSCSQQSQPSQPQNKWHYMIVIYHSTGLLVEIDFVLFFFLVFYWSQGCENSVSI